MDPDHRIRAAAFVAISLLSRRFDDHVPWDAISDGFSMAGEKILFANRRKGIFKPKQMSAALSIKTTVPRSGRTTWYRDQDSSNLDGATGLLRYDLARDNDPTNDALRKAWQRGAHLIYLMGVAPAVYQPVFPVWIADFSPAGRHVLLATADSLVAGQQQPDQQIAAVKDSVEVSYSSTTARTRNHQAWFSARTRAAYRTDAPSVDFRCGNSW
jgi:putative restriction endonuclease